MKKLLLILTFSLIVFVLQAQYSWELGVFAGAGSYQGDITPTLVPGLKNSAVGFGIVGRYVLDYKWSLRPGLYVSNLKGDDLDSGDPWRMNVRRANFLTQLTEISCLAEFEPFGEHRYLGGRGFKKMVSPYVFAGLGFCIISPDSDFSKANGSAELTMKIEEDINADILSSRIIIPIGTGVKFDLAELWNVSIEVGARATFTDYLDGLSASGNPDANDWYFFTGLTVFHRFKTTMKN